MNNTRRKLIEKVIEELKTLKEEIDNLTTEEQDAYNNLPKGIQTSERDETINDNINDLENTSSSIEEIIYKLNYIKEI